MACAKSCSYDIDVDDNPHLMYLDCHIPNRAGKITHVRALADTGALYCMITLPCVKRLGLEDRIDRRSRGRLDNGVMEVGHLSLVYEMHEHTIKDKIAVIDENSSTEMYIGCDFFWFTYSVIDFGARSFKIDQSQRTVQFLSHNDKVFAAGQVKFQETIDIQRLKRNLPTEREYMLHRCYVQCYVNKHMMSALIDTGCSDVHMSETCAEKCNIMTKLDASEATNSVHFGKNVNNLGLVADCTVIIGNKPVTMDIQVEPDDGYTEMILGVEKLIDLHCVMDLKTVQISVKSRDQDDATTAVQSLPQESAGNVSRKSRKKSRRRSPKG